MLLLTTGEAGLALGLSDHRVRSWVAAGRLPAGKRGVRTMIPRDAVLEEIERSRRASACRASRRLPAPESDDDQYVRHAVEQLGLYR